MSTTPQDIKDIVEKLSGVSVKDFANPYETIDWPEEMDKDQWFTSPRFISLNGTEAYEALSEDQQKTLSFSTMSFMYCGVVLMSLAPIISST